MKSARLLKIENRLGELVRQPGGKRIAEALKAAETRVQGQHDQLIAALPDATARLKALADAGGVDPALALEDLYVASNQIFALAAALSLRNLADAAYSLCDLVDGFRDGGQVSWAAVHVHVDAIRLLGANTEADASQAAVAAGLRRVGERFLGANPAGEA